MERLVHKLSVKSLVQRVEQTGDIHFRFSSRSNAADGVRGHQKLQKSRGEGYLAEQTVSDLISFDDDEEGAGVGFDIEINGRADGCWPDTSNFGVEEIKTIKVDVEKIPEQVSRVHWAQLKVYGYLLGVQYGVSEMTLKLTYYHIDKNQEYTFDDHWTLDALKREYNRIVEAYASFQIGLNRWRHRRDATIATLSMPFGEFRTGQREMAVSVYRALANNAQVVLQAPTGIGKTMGSLFPATKALFEKQYSRIFFLSAKTSGQQMARTAIEQMRGGGLMLRDVTLTAKDKICFNPGVPCDPEQCQYAKGYYDKLPGVIEKTVAETTSFDRAAIEVLAKENQICPFELSLDLTDIADVVVGDYNYVFDPTVYLRRHFDEPQKYALLMDETHNLVDRGRDMFSAELCKDDILALRRLVGDSAPAIKKALTAINREMLGILKSLDLKDRNDASASVKKFPDGLERSLTRFISVAESWLDDHIGSSFHPELLSLYFDVLRFVRVGEQADEKFACLVTKSKQGSQFKWFCINPASRLAEGFERLTSSVCFSATLSPQNYFRTLLGLNADSSWYQLESPFDPENLGVFVTSFLSTTYRNREDSLYDLVDTLATVITSKSGNYMVFFPSHAYLKMVHEKFQERHPSFKTLVQQASMSDEAREAFLAAFSESGDDPICGFAVMGGIFGEGIDLKGNRLIGAIVVGVGLPQIGEERNLIRDHFDELGGPGYEYAYQFPGMNRVLQTAGRVIRSEHDKGIVCLIDHRFNEVSYQQLYPPNWQISPVRSIQQLQQGLAAFWVRHSDGSG